MKDIEDNKINVAQKVNFVLGRVENIMGKGEILVTSSIFPFSCNVFKSYLSTGPEKSGLCGEEIAPLSKQALVCTRDTF